MTAHVCHGTHVQPENKFWDSVFIFHFVFQVGSLFPATLFQAGLNNSPIKMLAFS